MQPAHHWLSSNSGDGRTRFTEVPPLGLLRSAPPPAAALRQRHSRQRVAGAAQPDLHSQVQRETDVLFQLPLTSTMQP